MRKALATFDVYDAETLAQMEELRTRWQLSDYSAVVATLLLRSQALDLAQPTLDEIVDQRIAEENAAVATLGTEAEPVPVGQTGYVDDERAPDPSDAPPAEVVRQPSRQLYAESREAAEAQLADHELIEATGGVIDYPDGRPSLLQFNVYPETAGESGEL